MARVRPKQPLIASVLDRLLDDDPEVRRELPASRHQVLHELKMSVRRDLENLLNTRIRCLALPDDCQELERSLVNYGIPDITGANLGSAQDRDEFCRQLQSMISQNEPRLKTVSIQPTPNSDTQDRTFRFRIDAMLIAEPAPEPVVFDSELRPGTGQFEVKGVAE
jgi:type VI secretion system protein ImpF